MSPTRIAIMNTESYSSAEAIRKLIHAKHGSIALFINSTKHLKPGILQQAVRNYRRSGLRFLIFLFLNFSAYAWLASFRDELSRMWRCDLAPSRALSLCAYHGIRYCETADVNSPEIMGLLSEQGIDLILVCYFDQILKEAILSIPQLGALNVHAALLPSFRGLFPVFRATQFGQRTAGVTIHEITDERIDAGPILDQCVVELPADMDVLKRCRLVNTAGVAMTLAVLGNLTLFRMQKQSQSVGTYYSFPTRADVSVCRERGVKITSVRSFLMDVLRCKGVER